MDKMKQKWKVMKSFVDDVIEEPEKYPERLAVFVLTDEELCKIFTKERLKILRTIKEKSPSSVKKLADIIKRDIAAVYRDLKLLQEYGLVKMKREGQRVRPVIDKEGIFLPLAEPKPISALAE
jgi:predicted transcriptional regulator